MWWEILYAIKWFKYASDANDSEYVNLTPNHVHLRKNYLRGEIRSAKFTWVTFLTGKVWS